MVYLTVFELFSWLQKRFRLPVHPSVRPSDPDTVANTALEATGSWSGKNEQTNIASFQ